jgi:CDGSH-type Zn-finger protein
MRVQVTDDGPYLVTGQVPLSRRRPVVSEYEEPLTWQTTETIGAPPTYRLCRCGASGRKPFCDGTHAKIDFDGTETASPSDYDARAKAYPGTGITMRDDRSVCEHAGFCGNRVTNVWKMVADTADTQIRAQLIAMVERCPSGALTYEVAGEVIEPDLRSGIGVIDDGPLAVTGGVTVARGDGSEEVRARVTLCRCGQSANKPFCDGSHSASGFRDAGMGDNAAHASTEP